MKILLGVTGGIAAYKAAELIRLFVENGDEVKVVPTENALRFIGSTTLEALSHNAVDPNLYTDVADVKHIELGKWADAVVVVPATASFIARTAAGIADDLLGNIVLATTAPIYIAPAMHTEMWENSATESNVATLQSRGFRLVGPGVGRLTGDDSGKGRLVEPREIFNAVRHTGALAGKKVLVTLGGTREPIDSVRFIGNYSSGKQGLAIARAARSAGAEVRIIAANVEVTGFESVVQVSTTEELRVATTQAAEDADVLIMVAAVADFRVENPATKKLKKSDLGDSLDLHLVANPDIIAGISPAAIFKVAFAAETRADLSDVALSKLESKACHMIVANDVSDGAVFGDDSNSVHIFTKSGEIAATSGTKDDVAALLIEQIARNLS